MLHAKSRTWLAVRSLQLLAYTNISSAPDTSGFPVLSRCTAKDERHAFIRSDSSHAGIATTHNLEFDPAGMST